ncbi:MAG: GNAT family N-acetyltransferase [Provencibacterium sp.]|jgi:GNAT superfamily N-acetyltransferase|nr:GNAT family N-acetyltransferase [Provencibacterium sp.]
MVEIKGKALENIAPIFNSFEETLIWSCLQGQMGRAFADSAARPRSARIELADFCFLAGEPDRELVFLPQGRKMLIFVPNSERWVPVLRTAHPGRCRRSWRYAFKKEDCFDRQRLQRFAGKLPPGFSLAPIEESLYQAAMENDWSRDFCANFSGCGDYCRRGIGVAVLQGKELVGGASSYTVYNGGIEIEIDIREDCRRLGLAQACAAQLILTCLTRGLYPSWDAANKGSLQLAQKLGYRFSGRYAAYFVMA